MLGLRLLKSFYLFLGGGLQIIEKTIIALNHTMVFVFFSGREWKHPTFSVAPYFWLFFFATETSSEIKQPKNYMIFPIFICLNDPTITTNCAKKR